LAKQRASKLRLFNFKALVEIFKAPLFSAIAFYRRGKSLPARILSVQFLFDLLLKNAVF